VTGPETGDLRADGPVERRAPHTEDQGDEQLALCRAAISGGRGLRYLAHYTNGVFDFAVHDLDPVPDDDPHERTGRHFSSETSELDRALRGVRSGQLIRVVLQTRDGAIYCCSVVPNEYLVGFALDAAQVRSADVATAELVTELRRLAGQGAQNPGGWFAAKPVGEDTGDFPVQRGSGDPRYENHDETTGFEPCRAAVSVADLHYVALWRNGAPSVVADHLEHRSVARFLGRVDADARRRRYREFGAQLPTIVGQLSRSVESVLGIRTTRLTLDLEQGAIYYRRVRAGEFLVGVTLDQDQVAHTEDKIAELSGQLARTP
jgi:hypothetical protein